MEWIQFGNGCAAYVSAATAAQYRREVEEDRLAREKARKEAEWRETTRLWLDNPANLGDENYSDIFKEYWGVRPPRW